MTNLDRYPRAKNQVADFDWSLEQHRDVASRIREDEYLLVSVPVGRAPPKDIDLGFLQAYVEASMRAITLILPRPTDLGALECLADRLTQLRVSLQGRGKLDLGVLSSFDKLESLTIGGGHKGLYPLQGMPRLRKFNLSGDATGFEVCATLPALEELLVVRMKRVQFPPTDDSAA